MEVGEVWQKTKILQICLFGDLPLAMVVGIMLKLCEVEVKSCRRQYEILPVGKNDSSCDRTLAGIRD